MCLTDDHYQLQIQYYWPSAEKVFLHVANVYDYKLVDLIAQEDSYSVHMHSNGICVSMQV